MQANRIVPGVDVACRLFATSLLLLVVSGCKEQTTTVSGTVTLDGRPLAVASDARGTVIFQPANGQGTMATGLIDSAGHFQLATGGSIEVAPGKYEVAVSVVRLRPKVEDAEQGTELVTPAKYVTAHESGLQAEVAPARENKLDFNLLSSADHDPSTSPDPPADVPEANGGAPVAEPAEIN